MNHPYENHNIINNNNAQIESLHSLEESVLKIGKEIGGLFKLIDKTLDSKEYDIDENDFIKHSKKKKNKKKKKKKKKITKIKRKIKIKS